MIFSKKPPSLYKRLIAMIFGFSILMGCILVIAAYRIALEEINEILDAQMQYLAERTADHAPQPTQSQFKLNERYHEEDLFVDIWRYEHHSDQKHDFGLLHAPVQQAGFYLKTTTQGDWYTYVLPLQDMQIQVSQQVSTRRNLAIELAVHMFLPYLLFIPLALAGFIYLIKRSLRPFETFKTELIQRDSNTLTPIQSTAYPIEFFATIDEMNQLFERISISQQQQKQFITDAAHELRSPLTALNLQTKILMNDLPDQPALKHLSQGLTRMQHLVAQLLTLAQQDVLIPQQTEFSQVALHEVVQECVEQLMNVALLKEQDLGFLDYNEVYLQSIPTSLHSIVHNLIDNAIKYTPSNGIINLSLCLDDDQKYAHLYIEDSGAGIPEQHYADILKRFYRVQNHAEVGSGLGLSIVHQAVKHLGGEIQFAKSPLLGGLHVHIQFPVSVSCAEPDVK